MSTPFLGQITPFAFGFAPDNWAMCNGQLLPINQNQALFALIGTTFGGNGIQTFALPNLQGRIAMNPSNAGYVLGQTGGEATHTLLKSETPAHTHAVGVSTAAAADLTASNNVPAVSASAAYSTGAPNTTLGSGTSLVGSNQPHVNMAPYLTVNYCISLTGIFPSRS